MKLLRFQLVRLCVRAVYRIIDVLIRPSARAPFWLTVVALVILFGFVAMTKSQNCLHFSSVLQSWSLCSGIVEVE